MWGEGEPTGRGCGEGAPLPPSGGCGEGAGEGLLLGAPEEATELGGASELDVGGPPLHEVGGREEVGVLDVGGREPGGPASDEEVGGNSPPRTM